MAIKYEALQGISYVIGLAIDGNYIPIIAP